MAFRIIQWSFLLGLAFYSLFIGAAQVSLSDLWRMDGEQLQFWWEIMLQSRIPRLCSILVVGSSMAISGLIMQRITNNRFVSPTTAGTMEWCRFGVMVAILYLPGASPIWRVGAAFVISLIGTSCFLAVIARVRHQNVILVPLIGIMLGGVVNAGAVFYAYQFDIVQNMASWLQGSFSLVIEGNYELLYASIPLMLLAYVYADFFTIAGMGRDAAVALGLNHASIMRMGLVIVSIISSITIVEVGYLPFIGLIVPNIVSIFRGDAVKKILFDTAWLGAIASSMIPSAVAAYTEGDDEQWNYNVASGIKFNMIIAIPCALGLTVLGQPVVRMLFSSSNYVLGGHMMTVGATAIIFYALSNVTGGALQSIDKMRIPVIHSAISLVIHIGIVSFFLACTNIGVYALLIGNITFPILVFILNLRAIKRYVPSYRQEVIKTFFAPLAAGFWMALAAVSVYGLVGFVIGSNLIRTMLAVCVAVVVYFTAFLLLKGLTKEELFDFPMGRRLYLLARKMHLMK